MKKNGMMNVKQYNYIEDYGEFCTVVSGMNELLEKLFEVLCKEEMIIPVYNEKLNLKEDKEYHMTIEMKEDGSSFFWIYPDYEEKNENDDYLIFDDYTDLENTLEIIKNRHY